MRQKVEQWDKQSFETGTQYNAFCVYRDMPTADRSIVRAFEEHKKDGGKGGLSSWKLWARKNHWVDRVADYDAHLEKLARKRLDRDRVDMLVRHAKQGKKLAEMGEKYLDTLDKQIPIVDAGDAIRMVDAGIKIERTAVGEPSQTVETRDTSPPEELTDKRKSAKVRKRVMEIVARADKDKDED